MKQKIIALAAVLLLVFSCAACGATSGSSSAEKLSASISTENMFTDRDYEVGYSDYVTVTLADGATATDGDGVTVDGDIATITAEGTYLFTGTLSNGQIIVDAGDSDKIQIVLDNASVTCAGSAALYVKNADKVFVTMAEDSENTLASSGEFSAAGNSDESSVDGAVFSKSDLTLNGNGTLSVSCEAGHGVVSKDDLKITSGTYVITSAKQGLSGKDSVRIADGTFAITSGTDGIHAENADDADKGFLFLAGGSFTIVSGTDGMDASGALTVLDGDYTITSGGGSANAAVKTDNQMGGGFGGGIKGGSFPTDGTAPTDWTPPTDGGTPPAAPDGTAAPSDAVVPADAASDSSADTSDASADTASTTSTKGLKSGSGIVISGGTFTVDSADDSIHTNGDLTVSGGIFALTSGDDGMHADATLTISGGTITIVQSYEGIEGAAIVIDGGTIDLTASDDGLNAAGGADSSSVDGRTGQNAFDADTSASITISDGKLTVNASGDGIDSNGSLTVSGGTIYVSGPTNGGNGALDYGSDATITGGVLIACGAVGMEQNFGDSSTQGSILVDFDSVIAAGTAVTLTDSSGTVLATFTPGKEYQSVVVSAPGVENGGTYTLSAGTQSETVEMTSVIYGSGSTMGGGFGGGKMGGNRPSRDTTTSATTGAAESAA